MKRKLAFFSAFFILQCILCVQFSQMKSNQILPNPESTPLISWDDPLITDPASYEDVMDSLSGWQNDATGAFNASFTPSLEATYYALYCLEAIGRLSVVDAPAVTRYLLSKYNATSGGFADNYTHIYEAYDFPTFRQKYHGYSECRATAYAVLALTLLDQAGLIDAGLTGNYLRSCQHAGSGGFLDAPGDATYPPELINSYWAVRALQALGETAGVDTFALAMFVDALTVNNPTWPFYNGFFQNEPDEDLWTLEGREYSHETAFYALALLDYCGQLAELSGEYWNRFLPYTYNATAPSFGMTIDTPQYHADAVGSGWALAEFVHAAIADPGQAAAYDINGVASYLVSRFDASRGLWRPGSCVASWDLYVTFSALFGLEESGRSGLIPSGHKDLLQPALLDYFTGVQTPSGAGVGAAPAPKKTGDISITSDIAAILAANGALATVDIPAAYAFLCSRFHYDGVNGDHLFDDSPFVLDAHYLNPLEYVETPVAGVVNFSRGYNSVVTTGKALRALLYLTKLDDFGTEVCALTELQALIRSLQVTNASLATHGGFAEFAAALPLLDAKGWYKEPFLAHFESTFWAVEGLAYIKAQRTGQYFQPDTVVLDGSYIADIPALVEYINNKRVIEGNHLYFEIHDSVGNSPLINTWKALQVLKRVDAIDTNFNSVERAMVKQWLIDQIPTLKLEELAAAKSICDALDLDIQDVFEQLDLNRIPEMVELRYLEEPHGFTNNAGILDFETIYWLEQFRQDSTIITGHNLPAQAGFGDRIHVKLWGFTLWDNSSQFIEAKVTSGTLLGNPLELDYDAQKGAFTGEFTIPMDTSIEGDNYLVLKGYTDETNYIERTVLIEVQNTLGEGFIFDMTTLPDNYSTIDPLQGTLNVNLGTGFLIQGEMTPDPSTNIAMYVTGEPNPRELVYSEEHTNGLGYYSLDLDLGAYLAENLSLWFVISTDFRPDVLAGMNYTVSNITIDYRDTGVYATGLEFQEDSSIEFLVSARLVSEISACPFDTGTVKFQIDGLTEVFLIPAGGSPYYLWQLQSYSLAGLSPGMYQASLTFIPEIGSPAQVAYNIKITIPSSPESNEPEPSENAGPSGDSSAVDPDATPPTKNQPDLEGSEVSLYLTGSSVLLAAGACLALGGVTVLVTRYRPKRGGKV